ncbi:MAG TPA: HupE/UreJ family protein [Sideroxyarcus sp.]|nr:HupE/UreJ family protein [Sideroxyarcus sp.]
MSTSSERNKSLVRAAAAALFLVGLPSAAYAHAVAGDAGGFLHGLAHPVGGLDHVCAMFAVGLWAAQMNGRAIWLLPLAFVAAMVLGGVLGMSAVALPLAEPGIILSLLVLGLLIAAAVRLPLSVGAMLAGSFAIFHGYAHGAEMPHAVSASAYALGFVLATAALHASGIFAALTLKALGRAQLLRYSGAGVVLCGVYLGFAA